MGARPPAAGPLTDLPHWRHDLRNACNSLSMSLYAARLLLERGDAAGARTNLDRAAEVSERLGRLLDAEPRPPDA